MELKLKDVRNARIWADIYDLDTGKELVVGKKYRMREVIQEQFTLLQEHDVKVEFDNDGTFSKIMVTVGDKMITIYMDTPWFDELCESMGFYR